MAEVMFKRKETDSEVNSYAIQDGQLWFTKEGHVFMDYDEDRIPMQNTPDSVMDDSSNNSVSNSVIKQYVDNAIDSIENRINSIVAWQNASVTSSFGSQTITLTTSMSDYNYYEIKFMQSTNTTRIMTTGKIPVGYGTILNWTRGYRPTGQSTQGNSISFEDGKAIGTTGSATTDNTYCIPYQVILYKGE